MDVDSGFMCSLTVWPKVHPRYYSPAASIVQYGLYRPSEPLLSLVVFMGLDSAVSLSIVVVDDCRYARIAPSSPAVKIAPACLSVTRVVYSVGHAYLFIKKNRSDYFFPMSWFQNVF